MHTVIRYDYTMEGSRKHILDLVKKEKHVTFEKIFDISENRIHAIFLFLNMLELIQQKYFSIMMGQGMNNFIIEYNEDRVEDPQQFEETSVDASLN